VSESRFGFVMGESGLPLAGLTEDEVGVAVAGKAPLSMPVPTPPAVVSLAGAAVC